MAWPVGSDLPARCSLQARDQANTCRCDQPRGPLARAQEHRSASNSQAFRGLRPADAGDGAEAAIPSSRNTWVHVPDMGQPALRGIRAAQPARGCERSDASAEPSLEQRGKGLLPVWLRRTRERSAPQDREPEAQRRISGRKVPVDSDGNDANSLRWKDAQRDRVKTERFPAIAAASTPAVVRPTRWWLDKLRRRAETMYREPNEALRQAVSSAHPLNKRPASPSSTPPIAPKSRA